ncbi:unnamed protein product [Bubo scandiacus]
MIRAGGPRVAAAVRAWARGRLGAAGVSSVPAAPPAAPEPRREKLLLPALSPSPVLRACSVPVPRHRSPVQAWVESLRHHDDERRGLTDLHPGVFAVRPRLDILHMVAMWQKNFKRISYAKVKTRAEVRGGRQEAVAAEGIGPGPARQHPLAPVARGGNRPRAAGVPPATTTCCP